jgi:hypothetical protein
MLSLDEMLVPGARRIPEAGMPCIAPAHFVATHKE